MSGSYGGSCSPALRRLSQAPDLRPRRGRRSRRAWEPAPVCSFCDRVARRRCSWKDTKHATNTLHRMDLTGVVVRLTTPSAGVVDGQAYSHGAVLLTHHHVSLPGPRPVVLARTSCTGQALRLAPAGIMPEQGPGFTPGRRSSVWHPAQSSIGSHVRWALVRAGGNKTGAQSGIRTRNQWPGQGRWRQNGWRYVPPAVL